MADDHGTPTQRHAGRVSSFFAGSGLRRRVWLVLAGVALVSYGWVDATAAPFSGWALTGVAVPGAVLGLVAYRPPARIPPPDEIDVLGMSYWVVCLAALFEWEASSFRDNSAPWHPSLTNIINPLIAPHPLKCAAIVAWLLAGWGLVRR